MRKLAPAQVSYRDNFLILYRVYMMMGHFISCLFEGKLHVNKIQTCAIQDRKHYACTICHSPPADQFHTQTVVISCLHDTSVKFHTGVKFSLWYNNHA